VIMSLWYYAAYAYTHLHVSGYVVTEHMDLFWACTAMFLGAMIMVILESLEQNMRRIKKVETGGQMDVAHWTDAAILLSDITQSVCGWIAGCAWSDWLFETVTVLNADPTAYVVLVNLAIVLFISGLSCYWLVMNTSSDGIEEAAELTEEEIHARAEAKATDRGEVEKGFIASTLGFFVLGGWLAVVRNLFAQFSRLIEFGIVFVDEKFDFAVPAKTGDLVAVLVFAPVFTVLAFSASDRVMRGLAHKAGLAEAPKGKAAQGQETVKKRRPSSVQEEGYTSNYNSSKELV